MFYGVLVAYFKNHTKTTKLSKEYWVGIFYIGIPAYLIKLFRLLTKTIQGPIHVSNTTKH